MSEAKVLAFPLCPMCELALDGRYQDIDLYRGVRMHSACCEYLAKEDLEGQDRG